jgi:hypothetical protein
MNEHACPIHGTEYWSETKLMTGTYSYCERCSDVAIEMQMAAIRLYLGETGYVDYGQYKQKETA